MVVKVVRFQVFRGAFEVADVKPDVKVGFNELAGLRHLGPAKSFHRSAIVRLSIECLSDDHCVSIVLLVEASVRSLHICSIVPLHGRPASQRGFVRPSSVRRFSFLAMHWAPNCVKVIVDISLVRHLGSCGFMIIDFLSFLGDYEALLAILD